MNEEYLAILNEVVHRFVVKERRGRYLELLSNPKRYEDGLYGLLNDPRHLDPDCVTEVPSNEDSVELLAKRLKELGVRSNCYVISSDFSELQEPLRLTEALDRICYNTNSMLYCPVSKIGYYEGHEGWRYILRRDR
jgi:hypothetical protein